MPMTGLGLDGKTPVIFAKKVKNRHLHGKTAAIFVDSIKNSRNDENYLHIFHLIASKGVMAGK